MFVGIIVLLGWALLNPLYAQSMFDISVLNAQKEVVPLSIYSNASVVLVVNVASNCGFTYTNYNDLKALNTKYHERGLQILAFPSNEFGEQEPGTDHEIQTFASNLGVNFPVFAKV